MAPPRDPGPPPSEAIDYLRRKGLRTGWDYREVWREEHSRAFTVANMMDTALLADVQRSITDAQESGQTADSWKKGMREELAKRGWWGRIKPPDPDDPAAVAKADLYMSRRLDTIWRVNFKQAAAAGTWERGMKSSSHPYVLYRVGSAREHRDQHLAWDGTLLPRSDPFWGVAAPMNAWGCTCYLRFVSRAQHRRYVRDGIAEPALGDLTPGRKPVGTESPRLVPQVYRNAVTGRVHTGYRGIDPGFERNPGVGRQEQLGEQFRRTDQKLALAWDVQPAPPTSARPDLAPISAALDIQLTDQATAGDVRASAAAIDRVHSVELPRLPVTDLPAEDDDRQLGAGVRVAGMLRSRAAPAAPPGHWEAERIDVRTGAGWILPHEVGHWIDLEELGGGQFGSAHSGDPHVRRVIAAIRKTPNVRRLEAARDRALQHAHRLGVEATRAHEAVRRAIGADDRAAAEAEVEAAEERYAAANRAVAEWGYWVSEAELFARAYQQWIAWRAGDTQLLDQVDRALAHRSEAAQLAHWPHGQFLRLIQPLDMLFEARGWLTRTRIERS